VATDGSKNAPAVPRPLHADFYNKIGTNRCGRSGRAGPLCPGISDINLFRYCEGIVHFDAQISNRAFYLCMSEKKLDGPEISCSAID